MPPHSKPPRCTSAATHARASHRIATKAYITHTRHTRHTTHTTHTMHTMPARQAAETPVTSPALPPFRPSSTVSLLPPRASPRRRPRIHDVLCQVSRPEQLQAA